MKRRACPLVVFSRGFTMIEVIVVMAILSIIMMAIMSTIIPTRHSMSMQSQVTDVQSNLHLAMNVINKDLLSAGFLVTPFFDPPTNDPDCPDYWKGDNSADNMEPGPIFWQGNDITEAVDDLTIRTRITGNAFAVVEFQNPDNSLQLTHADMRDNFCNGNTTKTATVRAFNPVTMADLDCAAGNYSCEMDPTIVAASLYTVDCDSGKITINRNVSPSTVIVGTRADALPLQTIRYRVNNGVLERIVNGNVQNLARGVTSINFAYGRSSSGTVNQVDVTLTGVIAAMKAGDAQLGEKTRTLTTTVNLRNVF